MSVFRTVWALFALLSGLLSGAAARADEFLDPDQAFQLTVHALADKRVELTYKIAPGYYLYRERFKFSAADAKLGEPRMPPGKKHYDSALEQTVEIYHDQVVVTLPVLSAGKAFTIAATHQGCAEKGLCYPPQPRSVDVSLKAFGAAADTARVATAGDGQPATANVALATTVGSATTSGPMSVAPGGATALSLRGSVLAVAPVAPPPVGAGVATSADDDSARARAAPALPAAPASQDKRIDDALVGGHLLAIISLAFGLGLGLSLLPCVWPMFPILSSIIVGQGGKVTPARGFLLALTYSLGMALVYTALGVVAGKLGEGFAGYLQSPPVLILFGVLLAVLSLSMFGVYELQLPAALRDRLNAKSEALSGGQLGGVFGMGVLSGLIVSPCVTAPLVTVLVYIGERHDAVLGGLALFAIAMGMSVPLLVIGTSAGTLLPRSGAWMERVKHVFGLALLGVAIYLVQPVFGGLISMIAWGALLILGAAGLGAFEPIVASAHRGPARLMKGFGLLLALLGVLQFVGLASGGRDPAQPLASLAQGRLPGNAVAGTPGKEGDATGPRFDRVVSVADLDSRLQSAGRPVMLDFYADWCVSCKEMESQTFVEPGVRARLANAVLLRADVTANSDDDRALLKRFHLFGPPGLIFFDAAGRELAAARVVGFQDAARFTQSLSGAGL